MAAQAGALFCPGYGGLAPSHLAGLPAAAAVRWPGRPPVAAPCLPKPKNQPTAVRRPNGLHEDQARTASATSPQEQEVHAEKNVNQKKKEKKSKRLSSFQSLRVHPAPLHVGLALDHLQYGVRSTLALRLAQFGEHRTSRKMPSRI